MSISVKNLPQSMCDTITSALTQFVTSDSSNTQQLHQALSAIQTHSEQQISGLNQYLQKQMKLALMKIMVCIFILLPQTAGDLPKVTQLIALLCDLTIQPHQNITTTIKKKPIIIKQSLAIIIVSQVLQCLGINDLKEILPIVSQKLCSFKQFDQDNQNRMLWIINHLLKRISKTEDYLIRGQLQFTLTKILPICHDSGFHYRIPTAKGIEIVSDQGEEFGDLLQTGGGITYQFYKDFWLLQKYLMDPNELTLDSYYQSSSSKPLSTDDHSKKPTSIYKTQPLLTLRLKQIEKVLSEVITYMREHPCSDSSSSNTLLNQPIKFLTNTHLLEYQLNDVYFRKIILLQVSIFAFTLTQLKSITNNVLKGIMLTQSDRIIINRIDSMALKYLEVIERNKQQNITLNQQKEETSIFDIMRSFFVNEIEWVEIKDHWKEKKKTFLRQDSIPSVEPQKQMQKQIKNTTGKQRTADYNKKLQQVQTKLAKQMSIEGDTLLDFLTQPCVPHIITSPTQTSFSYYWSQGKSCLESFDFDHAQQKQFQSRSEYNMFEWKALRSLYRDSIKDLCLIEKNPKLREYKVLAYIEQREKHFATNQKQTQPSTQQITAPTPTDSKNKKLFVIEEVAESKQRSIIRNSQQNQSKLQQHPSPIKEIHQEQDDSPKKKQKLQ